MKLLVVASVLDLSYPFGCTSAWWQLLKALHEAGTEIIATPYHGPPVESLWWRTEPNPCQSLGRTYEHLRTSWRHTTKWLPFAKQKQNPKQKRRPSKLENWLLQKVVAP